MRSVQVWLEEYGESHENSTNKLIHWICVPAILFSVLGLIWSLPTPASLRAVPLLNWATIVLALALLYYVRLSVPLALGMLLVAGGMIALLHALARTQAALWQISVSLFVAAWIGQFIGHRVEGKRPSFLKDIQFLLIGPLWLLGFIYRRLGIPY